MDKESLTSKNDEELKQTPEDLNVEHYSSGSDNDNTSEISLTIEDGTKDLTKNKEISGGDEASQVLQNLADYFDKSSEDTDEEIVDENQDFCDQDDHEDQNSADLEENQDDAKSYESYEQDEGLNNSPDDDEININSDPQKEMIEEEFRLTYSELDELIHRSYPGEYMLDLNVNRYIKKDVSYRSMGLCADKKPYMFIFTITKNFTLTCEVYLENYEKRFTEDIKDLLRITHHIYFIGVKEENNEKFDEFWIDLYCNFYDNDNKVNIEYHP